MNSVWPPRVRSRVFRGVSPRRLRRHSARRPGRIPTGAFWIDTASGQFTTSTYYMQHLPEWATAFNSGPRIAQAEHDANADGTAQFFDLVGRTPAANS